MAEQGEPSVDYCFSIDVDLELPISVMRARDEQSLFIPIVGGRVHGPRLNGRVLPHGGDWAVEHADGSMSIHARYFIEAADGTVIGVDNSGVWRERLGDAPYFVTTPVFTVGEGTHAWLEHCVFVGMARETSETNVTIDVYSTAVSDRRSR